MNSSWRKIVLPTFLVLSVISGIYLFQLKFSFDFEQFFPEGDEDLEFFKDFISEFETDDNFLLIAIKREEGVFEQAFLEKFHDFTLKTRDLPYVEESQSLTKFGYPIKTPFAVTTIPAIHIDKPELYERDKARILNDERFVNNLITKDAKAMVVLLKTVNSIQLEPARELMTALNELIESYNFEGYHYLGRPYFQKELVAMQKREIIVSGIISSILVSLIMFWIFRKPWGIAVALISIGLGMLLFMGFLGVSGRELNAMAALYPVLMIIVGTSDVIHIMSKYVDELRKGKTKREAIRISIREIGMATLLTSITTAIGFASLMTSRITPIRDFGLNSAIGVLIAYITVIFFTTAVLSYFDVNKIIKLGRGQLFWERLMEWSYQYTKRNGRQIAFGGALVLGLCFLGISMITTNYNIISNMPIGKKITEDFLYFEEKLTGFRPMEFAVYAQGDYTADDYEVVQEINKVETHLRQFPEVQAIASITTVYKSINQMYGSNKPEAYKMPDTERKFNQYQRMVSKLPQMNVNVLVSKDKKKARITSRVLDMGADSLKYFGNNIDQWIASNTDANVVKFKRTGTGVIIDKNAEYVRENLLQGLGMAILIVSFIMVLLFRNWKMLIISLVPNVFPLLLAGALLGFLGIELEAGVSIVFAVIFGIAVDDTIHFLSKFKLAQDKGLSLEESLRVTFLETGKAICLTTVILFFGFMVMLFSIHPPSVVVGLLISLTLFSALIADLSLIPVLIRWLMKDESNDVNLEERPNNLINEPSSVL